MRRGKKYSKEVKKSRLRNKKLVKKYPWLKPRNVWTGRLVKDYDYSWINWGCLPGWDVAYGDMYLKELGEAVKNQKDFMILEIKEKYGMNRCYTNGTTREAHNIIDKYEFISSGICYQCGKPDVPMVNAGWICPECFDCFKKRMRGEHSKYRNATEEEIRKLYDELADEPNEDGTWRIPDVRRVKHWDSEHDEPYIIEYDISDTVKAIRDRYERRRQHYVKRIHRSRHTS
jgi:hypothetical protein